MSGDSRVTKEQHDKLKAIRLEYEGKARDLVSGKTGGSLSELWKECDRKAIETLTTEQQMKFTALKGKPFDTDLLMRRVPRRGGGKE